MMENNNHITAFAIAQANMEAAIKSAKNPFLGNNYASLDKIQEKVFPAFHAEGFAVVQEGGADEFGEYIDTKMVHQTGNFFNCKVYLQYKKSDMQSLGGAITYARRYGLLSVTGLPTEDDDGNTAITKEEAEKKVYERATKLEKWLHENCNSKRDLELQEKNANAVFSGLLEFNKGYAGQLIALWEEKENEIISGFK
jgi:hypothetical protein